MTACGQLPQYRDLRNNKGLTTLGTITLAEHNVTTGHITEWDKVSVSVSWQKLRLLPIISVNILNFYPENDKG